jgi:hypothetical protein
MSTNSIRFHCTGCDYEYLEHFQPITLKCKIGDEEATYYRTTAWCNQCDTIRYVECIPTLEELQKDFDEFIAPFIEPPATWIRKFISLIFRGGRPSASDNRRSDSVKELNNQIAWRQARTAPPHCLTCGTTDLTQVDFENISEDMTVAKNFRHSCGGSLVRDHNDDPGIRFHFRKTVIWMDIEGNRLTDSENE